MLKVLLYFYRFEVLNLLKKIGKNARMDASEDFKKIEVMRLGSFDKDKATMG